MFCRNTSGLGLGLVLGLGVLLGSVFGFWVRDRVKDDLCRRHCTCTRGFPSVPCRAQDRVRVRRIERVRVGLGLGVGSDVVLNH